MVATSAWWGLKRPGDKSNGDGIEWVKQVNAWYRSTLLPLVTGRGAKLLLFGDVYGVPTWYPTACRRYVLPSH